MKKFLILGGSAILVTIVLVVLFKWRGGVRIGPSAKLAPPAVVLMTKLLNALQKSEQNSALLVSENAKLMTTLRQFESLHPNPVLDVRLIIDGLRLENTLVGNDAELNANALRILIGVDTEILAGDGYEQIDPSLQLLEQTFPQRDASIETVSNQEKLLAKLLENVRSGDNGKNISSQQLDFLRAMIDVQEMKAAIAIEDLKNIKIVTKTLRGVVDDMATGRGTRSK